MITPWFPWPDTPIRGIWVIDQARSVAREHEVAILAFRPKAGTPGPFELSEGQERGLRTLRLAYPPPRVPGMGMRPTRRGTLEALGRLRADGFAPDVVHAHVFLSAPAALPAARLLGAPLVIQEHLTRVMEGQLGPLERTLARLCYRHADVVCPASRALADPVRRLGARVVTPVPNALDTDSFPARPPREPGAGATKAIAVGSLHEKKGHRYLLEALPKVLARRPEFRLDLVGDGPLRDRLEALSGTLGVTGAVTFHGYADKPRVAELMRGSDLHVLPSLRENLPLVVAEAMASGLPTVGTAVGGVPEMLEGRTGVTVPPADPAALADAILRTCEELDSYEPARLAAIARERYGLATVGSLWTALYESVLSGKRQRRGVLRSTLLNRA